MLEFAARHKLKPTVEAFEIFGRWISGGN